MGRLAVIIRRWISFGNASMRYIILVPPSKKIMSPSSTNEAAYSPNLRFSGTFSSKRSSKDISVSIAFAPP